MVVVNPSAVGVDGHPAVRGERFSVPQSRRGGVMVGAAVTDADRALAEVDRVRSEMLIADARIENAKRALDAALDDRQRIRQELREAVLAAREAGATFPQIAAVLDVSVQRAHALTRSRREVRRR
jgi:hypothetical protein